MLALAQGHPPFFFDYKLDRRKFRAFVRTVTKRLLSGTSTLTPVIGPGVQIQDTRLVVGYERICHFSLFH